MRKKATSLLVLLIIGLVAINVYAAVVIQDNGTRVGPTDKLNLVGPTITESGGVTSVDLTALTDLTVADDIYADTGLSVDGSIYLTGGGGMSTPILIRQPDGGCSQCGVDDAGTTFSCVDCTCPAGMTQ